MSTSNTSTRAIRCPFTTTQWQEFEHQSLIFKYIVLGVPIPPELIYSVKRSLESAISSRLFPHNPPIGWRCFEMGFGRKVEPEPGRCRRTDGKKWRCSKEAYLNSNYCEKHMHRGRNRSKKPVEVSSATTSTIASRITNASPTISSISRKLSCTSSTVSSHSSLSSPITPEPNAQLNSPFYPSPYPHFASSRLPGYALSAINNITTPYFSTKSEPCNQVDQVYSCLSSNSNFQGIKKGQDELTFFPESSGNARSLDGMSHPLLKSYRGYSQPQYQGITDNSKETKQLEEQHCFILGTDFKSPNPIQVDKELETRKHLHHFFGEWPPKNTDSWLDLAPNSKVHNDG